MKERRGEKDLQECEWNELLAESLSVVELGVRNLGD